MSIVLDGTANTVTPLNGALGATTPSTVAATTVVASSTIKGATTIAVGNATPSASGAGITFPATQSASTDANTLDDYEEGTWTPTVAGTSTAGTVTYGLQASKYTKIGNVVYISFYLGWSGGTGTGNLKITGLPFTPSTNTTFPALSIGMVSGLTLTASNFPTCYAHNSLAEVYFLQSPVGGGTSTNVAYDAAVGELNVSGFYYTA